MSRYKYSVPRLTGTEPLLAVQDRAIDPVRNKKGDRLFYSLSSVFPPGLLRTKESAQELLHSLHETRLTRPTNPSSPSTTKATVGSKARSLCWAGCSSIRGGEDKAIPPPAAHLSHSNPTSRKGFSRHSAARSIRTSPAAVLRTNRSPRTVSPFPPLQSGDTILTSQAII